MHPAVALAAQNFQKTLDFLLKEFSSLQIGRASPGMVEGVEVEAYGSKQPLRNLGQIAITDARTITITSWDKAVLPAIEKAIRDANTGLMPLNNGNSIHINIPPLTEERRREMGKTIHKMAEEAKVTIRQQRQEAMDKIKKDDALSEDEEKRAEKELQEKVDEYNRKLDEQAKHKEEEVMKV